jgi:predicted aldo/keto reductase-like oxidoreductase
VQQALEYGIRAFDTSPYYGPSEEILGAALDTPFVRANVPRDQYFLLTKVGRIAGDEFDYSPAWVRQSVARSLRRLKTEYLDVVYCHDVEFVSEEEVMEAVRELRRIRDEEGTIKYIGISGYPLPVLCSLARKVLAETGEPLDAVMSYANFTLQNELLATTGIKELKAAGVDATGTLPATTSALLSVALQISATATTRSSKLSPSAGRWRLGFAQVRLLALAAIPLQASLGLPSLSPRFPATTSSASASWA